MTPPPAPSQRTELIADYIRQHRDTYTHEAISDALLSAGYGSEEVAAAWRQLAERDRAAAVRPSWQVMLTLLVLGTIGAFGVWQGQLYRAGALAAVIYLGVATLAIALGYLVAWLANRGHRLIAAAILVVIGIAAALWASGNGIFVMWIVAGLFPALALALLLAGPERRRVALVAAAVPILLWLIVTGTCYAPLLSGGV
jgi:cation transport ATPase